MGLRHHLLAAAAIFAIAILGFWMIRKPVPPPQRVIPDRRRKIREDQDERERRNPER